MPSRIPLARVTTAKNTEIAETRGKNDDASGRGRSEKRGRRSDKNGPKSDANMTKPGGKKGIEGGKRRRKKRR